MYANRTIRAVIRAATGFHLNYDLIIISLHLTYRRPGPDAGWLVRGELTSVTVSRDVRADECDCES